MSLRRSFRVLEDRLARWTSPDADVGRKSSSPAFRVRTSVQEFADAIVLFLIQKFRYLLSAMLLPLEYWIVVLLIRPALRKEDAIEALAFIELHKAARGRLADDERFECISMNDGCAISLLSAPAIGLNRILGLTGREDLDEA